MKKIDMSLLFVVVLALSLGYTCGVLKTSAKIVASNQLPLGAYTEIPVATLSDSSVYDLSTDPCITENQGGDLVYNISYNVSEALIDDVRLLEGVEFAYNNIYNFTVIKGKLFEWDDIHPKILELIKRHSPPDLAE